MYYFERRMDEVVVTNATGTTPAPPLGQNPSPRHVKSGNGQRSLVKHFKKKPKAALPITRALPDGRYGNVESVRCRLKGHSSADHFRRFLQFLLRSSYSVIYVLLDHLALSF